MSVITNGRPSNFNIIPKRDEEGWVLGSVTSNNSVWYNQALIALAPLSLFVFSIFFLELSILNEVILVNLIFKIYILANLIEGAIPSFTDFSLAIKKPFGIMLAIGGILWII